MDSWFLISFLEKIRIRTCARLQNIFFSMQQDAGLGMIVPELIQSLTGNMDLYII